MHKIILKSLSLLSLFALGIICTYYYLIQGGFGIFNLITPGNNSSLESYGFDEFMRGDKATGHFSSAHNNLGIVAVRFTNKNRDSKDVVIFRIKEVGSNAWYYEAKYNTDQFQPGKFFPFGFPQIPTSKGKNFTYEIESTSGATGSGIFLDYQKPVFVSVSFFDKAAIGSRFQNLITFAGQKLVNVLGNKDDLIQVIIFFSPAIFMVTYLVFGTKNPAILYYLFIAGVIFDIVFVPKNSNFLSVSLIALWLLAKVKHKTNSIFSLFGGLCLATISLISSLFKGSIYAEKAFVWVFILFLYTCYEQYLESKLGAINSVDFTFAKKYVSEIIKKNKARYKKIVPFLNTLSLGMGSYLFIQSLSVVRSGFNIYIRYFSGVIPTGISSQFVTILMLIFGAFFILLIVSVKLFKTKTLLFMTLSMLLYQTTNLSVNRLTSFQYQPKMFTISPQKSSEAWVDVTIGGINFKDKPFVGKLFLGGVEQQENIILWTDTKVVFRTNPAKTKSGKVCIQTTTKESSNCLPFEYNFSKK